MACRAIDDQTINLGQPRAAQSSSRSEKRQCLQQVGLAGTIRSGENDRTWIGLDPSAGVTPKISKVEATNRDLGNLGGHGVELAVLRHAGSVRHGVGDGHTRIGIKT